MSRPARTLFVVMIASSFLCGGVVAQEETPAAPNSGATGPSKETKAVDPSGTWRWERDFGGNKMEFQLKLNWDGKSLKGDYTSFDTTSPIENGKFSGNELSFSVHREFNGNAFEVDFAGQIRDDQITGTTKVEFGGEPREFEWQTTRSVEPSDVVGTWKLRMDTPNGVIEPQVTFTQSDGKLQGTYKSVFGEREAKNVELKDNVISWEVSGETDDFTFKAVYEGKPRGDKITGTNSFDFNGNTGSIEFTGQKSATEQPASEERPQRPASE